MPTNDPVFDENTHARLRAAALCRTASDLIARSLLTRQAIARGRGQCATRRLLRLAAGGSDADTTPDPAAAQVVRAKIARGSLRRDPCVGGVVVLRGSQHPCNGCGWPIPADEVEMRARFVDGDLLRFHAWCFDTWYRAVNL